ncbi:MAG: CPBP family intramembrane glutamic endopeptidase [Nanoarchaeota archaeon]
MRISLLDACEAILGYLLFVWIIDLVIRRLPSKGLTAESWALLQLVLVLAVLVVFHLLRKRSESYYCMRLPEGDGLHLMLKFVVLLMPLALIARLAVPSFDAWYAGLAGLGSWTAVLSLSALMPILVMKEELIERILIQRKLEAYPVWIVLVVVSLNFAFAHFFWNGSLQFVLAQTLAVFFGSLLLVLFFAMTRNIWLSILLHLIYNLLIVLQIYLHVARPMMEWVFWIVMILLCAAVLPSAARRVKDFFAKSKRHPMSAGDWVFIALFALVVPVAFIVLSRFTP